MTTYLAAQASAQTSTNSYADIAETDVAVPAGETAIIVLKNTGANAVDFMPQFRYRVGTAAGGAEASAWTNGLDTAITVNGGNEIVLDSRTIAPLGGWFKVQVKSNVGGSHSTVTVWGAVAAIDSMAAMTARAIDPADYESDDATTISALATLLGKFDATIVPAGAEAADVATANSEADDLKTDLDSAAATNTGAAPATLSVQAAAEAAAATVRLAAVEAMAVESGAAGGYVTVDAGITAEAAALTAAKALIDSAAATNTGAAPATVAVQVAAEDAAATARLAVVQAIEADLNGGAGSADVDTGLGLVAASAAAIEIDANAIAALVSGDGATNPEAQLAVVEVDLTAVDAALENAAGAAGTIEANAAIVQARIGAWTGITCGPEVANTAPVEFTAVDSGGAAVGETKTLNISLLNNADDSILATTAYTLTATTGTVTNIAGGAVAVYRVVTDAAGAFVGQVNDVAGAGGVLVKFSVSVEDGNTVFFEAGPVLTNIQFD